MILIVLRTDEGISASDKLLEEAGALRRIHCIEDDSLTIAKQHGECFDRALTSVGIVAVRESRN